MSDSNCLFYLLVLRELYDILHNSTPNCEICGIKCILLIDEQKLFPLLSSYDVFSDALTVNNEWNVYNDTNEAFIH